MRGPILWSGCKDETTIPAGLVPGTHGWPGPARGYPSGLLYMWCGRTRPGSWAGSGGDPIVPHFPLTLCPPRRARLPWGPFHSREGDSGAVSRCVAKIISDSVDAEMTTAASHSARTGEVLPPPLPHLAPLPKSLSNQTVLPSTISLMGTPRHREAK